MIIGIMGLARSGKDEFAKIAIEEFNAIRVAFADAVKEEVSEFLKDNDIPFEERNLWGSGNDKEEIMELCDSKMRETIIEPLCLMYKEQRDMIYIPFRHLLQWWGTEYRRSQDTNYWINRALSKCRIKADPYSPFGMSSIQYIEYIKEKQKKQLYVISDVRFLNEAKAIKSVGGKLVKVVRPDAPFISNMNHISEQELKDYEDYDYLILNNGTLNEYYENCKKIIVKIIGDYNNV